MGVNLTPILEPQVLDLAALRGRRFAVDGNNVLYQFLALIRKPDGRPLTDRRGRVTSHLVGLLYRTTRLLSDYRMEFVFVFDGRPPRRKGEELAKRRAARERAEAGYVEAIARGDLADAWSKAVTSTRLTSSQVEDAQRLLTLLGIPWMRAPAEGEAQAAHLCRRGDAWAAATRDYDALLYGAPRLLRYLTVSGQEYLPSRGTARPLEPELLELSRVLSDLGLTRRQLVDVALLIGTDYQPGVKGIGPKRALHLIRAHGRLEDVPPSVRSALPADLEGLRGLFLDPTVEADYELRAPPLDVQGVVSFLCEDRDFARDRVTQALERVAESRRQASLDGF